VSGSWDSKSGGLANNDNSPCIVLTVVRPFALTFLEVEFSGLTGQEVAVCENNEAVNDDRFHRNCSDAQF